jgi:polyisoprenoid-binding protein YceI
MVTTLNTGSRTWTVDTAHSNIGFTTRHMMISKVHGSHRIGYSAKTRVDRRDFGLIYNQALEADGLLIGNDVEIELDIEAVASAA